MPSSRISHGLLECRPVIPLKSAFRDLRSRPVPSYSDAIAPIIEANLIPEFEDYAQITYLQAVDAKRLHLKDDPIPVDGVAALMKYTAEDTLPPLYADLNARCYQPERSNIKPYAAFLWLLSKSLALIPAYAGHVVYRGVKVDLRDKYPQDREFTWHGPCSCTKSLATLSNPTFLGKSGPRTIFTIELTQLQARDITRYSLVPQEEEVLLPAGCRFRVVSVLEQGELTLVSLCELPSNEWLFDLRTSGAVAWAPPTQTPSTGAAVHIECPDTTAPDDCLDFPLGSRALVANSGYAYSTFDAAASSLKLRCYTHGASVEPFSETGRTVRVVGSIKVGRIDPSNGNADKFIVGVRDNDQDFLIGSEGLSQVTDGCGSVASANEAAANECPDFPVGARAVVANSGQAYSTFKAAAVFLNLQGYIHGVSIRPFSATGRTVTVVGSIKIGRIDASHASAHKFIVAVRDNGQDYLIGSEGLSQVATDS